MKHLTINYLQSHTDLRAGKLDFHEFMRLINEVYEFGFKRGELHGIEMCKEELEKWK